MSISKSWSNSSKGVDAEGLFSSSKFSNRCSSSWVNCGGAGISFFSFFFFSRLLSCVNTDTENIIYLYILYRIYYIPFWWLIRLNCFAQFAGLLQYDKFKQMVCKKSCLRFFCQN